MIEQARGDAASAPAQPGSDHDRAGSFGDLSGRRERKKRATYLALRAAALDLVSERGFANVTVEDIAESVDVSVRTFFNYFSSKEDALVGEDSQLRQAMRSELLAVPADVPPLEALRRVMVGRLRAIAEDLDLSGEDHEVWARRFAVVHAQPEVHLAYAKHLTGVERFIADTLVERAGSEAHRAEASLTTAVAMAAMRTVAKETGTGGVGALIERAEAAFDLMASGFRSPEGDDPATSGEGRIKTATTHAERTR